MKIKDIMDMTPGQFSKLPREAQERTMRFVASQANSRMTKLENSGLSNVSYTYNKMKESGGRIRTTGTPQEMKSDFIRGKQFLKAETSKVTGTRRVITAPFKPTTKAQEKRIAQDLSQKIGKGSKNSAMWKAVDKAREMNTEAFLGSERLINMVHNRFDDDFEKAKDVDAFIDEVAKFAAEQAKKVI